MRWAIAWIRVACNFCLLIACLIQTTVFAQEIDSLRKGVVKLSATANGVQKTGTGFIVRHDKQVTFIITAMHVVEGDKFPKVAFYGQVHSWIDTEVLRNDPRNDISLLKVRDNTQVPVNAASLHFLTAEDLKDNDELSVIGFPGAIDWARIIVALAGKDGLDLIIDRQLQEGFSGAPLIKHNKEVIGLITRTDDFGRAIPSDIVRKIIAGWGVTTSSRPSNENEHSTTSTTAKPASETRLPFEPDMVRIPSGSFLMGSPETEAGRDSDEGPQHRVNVASFAISRTEITVAQFRQFVQDSRYQTTAEKNGKGCWGWNTQEKKAEHLAQRNWSNPGFKQADDHPVVCISWDDTQAYLAWLTDRTGVRYRLPTEAEWEYAARAETTTARYYRDDQQCDYANGLGQEAKSIAGLGWSLASCADGYVYTAPVARFSKNPFGLSDMLGNVGEWIQDCWHENYNDAPTDGSTWLEKNSGDCNRRVVRGGSWIFKPQYLRSAFRGRYGTDDAYNILGFRIARAF
jgi:formylglycine-generating enzyme required for sulfatase activity